MALLSSDISRIVHHFLLEKGYETTANNFIVECADLKGLKPVKTPYKPPRLLGPSLLDLLNGYYDAKDYILEELDTHEAAVYNELDSLPTLTKILVIALKQAFTNTSSRSINKKCCDASTNTDLVVEETKLKLDASVSTEDFSPSSRLTVNVSTCTSDISESCNSKNEDRVSKENETSTSKNQDSAQADQVVYVEEDSNSRCSSYPPSVEPCEEISFFTSLVVDRLIENREIQERIAEKINKRSTDVLTPKKTALNYGDNAVSQDINPVYKAIAEEATADPAFNAFLKECLGVESSQGPTPVGSPRCVLAQENDQPSPAVLVSELEPSVQDLTQPNKVLGDSQQLLVTSDQNALIPLVTSCTTANNNNYASLPMSQLGSYICITDGSGQITLVPSMATTAMQPVLALPAPQDVVEVPDTGEPKENPRKPRVKKKPVGTTRKPALLAPKPAGEPLPFVITIPDLTNYLNTGPVQETVKVVNASHEKSNATKPAPTSKPKAIMKKTDQLRIKKSKDQGNTSSLQVPTPDIAESARVLAVSGSPTVAHGSNPPAAPAQSPNQPPENSESSTRLDALLKIAKQQADIISLKLPTPLQASTGIRPDSETAITTPAPESASYSTTPTSGSRRKTHVRQLNFGESPDLPISSSQPLVVQQPSQNAAQNSPIRSIKPQVPWDLALRSSLAAASPAKDHNLFATPKGKAKRARKTSPIGETPTNAGSQRNSDVKRTLQEPAREQTVEPEKEPEEIDLTAHENFEDSSVPEITQPEISPPSSFIASKPCSRDADSNDKAAACVLIEMANSNPAPATEEHASLPNVTQFSLSSAQKDPLPMHATPQKDPVMYEGHSSMSFGAWDGEIPRTPQIRLDVTNSNSPFQVSLTKGFRFLPAAESPSLPVPSTPSISGTNSNSSIETPYIGFNQFASILNTPRVEALRNEFGDSPSRSLSTTMISPTQVVLGRSAPYFVPSGERAQGPPLNAMATPEHVPEIEKKTRRRRSSNEMEPLQLEESNDASDAATALMSEAAASVAAALQRPFSQTPTPVKSDQTLESDLISECNRLENAPPTERGMTRSELFLSLFGEDSETAPSPKRSHKSAATDISKPTRKQRGRRTKTDKKREDETSKRTAKKTTVNSKPKAQRKHPRTINSSSEDEAGAKTPEMPVAEDNESIIRELLSLARIKRVGETSPPKKRKRSSLEGRELDAGSRTPPSKRLPPSSGSKCPPSDITSPGSEVNRDIASTSIEASFSQEELEAPGGKSPKKRPGRKAEKDKRKHLKAIKLCSPIPKIIRNTVIKTPAAPHPVKLFKQASPFKRLTGSRRPIVAKRRAVISSALDEGRELELSSIPEESSLVAENNNQADHARNEITENVQLRGLDMEAQPSKSFEETPRANSSIVNNTYCEDADNETSYQGSIFNNSTVPEGIRSPERHAEQSPCLNSMPVSSVSRSNNDLSVPVQPVIPPVDLPGPSRIRDGDAPDSGNEEKKQTLSEKQKKKRSDPRLQSYLLLSSASTKSPKTNQLDPVPFQTVKNLLVTPSNGACVVPSVSPLEVEVQRRALARNLRAALKLSRDANIFTQ